MSRPFVYVGTPGTLDHFHLIQSVAETLLRSPHITGFLSHDSKLRQTFLLQLLHSIYRQTDRDWEILFSISYSETNPHFLGVRSCLAIPNLLPILPTIPKSAGAFHHARTPVVAYLFERSTLDKKRFELQRNDMHSSGISATQYVDEGGQRSSNPPFGRMIGTAHDFQTLRGTFMVSKHAITRDGSFDPTTPIRTIHRPLVTYIKDAFQWSPPPQSVSPLVLQSESEKHVHRGESSLVSGMHPSGASHQLLHWRARTGTVTQAKKMTGLKYLL
jgi:hypothetical protein